MTNEDILKLAETCGITPNKYKICISWEEELLKFAREIYAKGQQEEIRRQKTGIGYVNGMLVVDEF